MSKPRATTKLVFAWLPTRINDTMVWLERYWVVEVHYRLSGRCYYGEGYRALLENAPKLTDDPNLYHIPGGPKFSYIQWREEQ
jgi:hypothetical protein